MPILKAEFELDDDPLPAPTVAAAKSTYGVFVKRKPAGEAGIGYEIFQTPPKEVARILREKRVDPKPYQDALEFCTLFLTLSARTIEPDRWGISWARYRFDIDGPNLIVPNYSPVLIATKGDHKTQTTHGFKGTLGAELGPSVETSTTGKKGSVETSIKTNVGAKVSSGIEYNWSRLNETSFVGHIDEVVGTDERDMADGGINLVWDVKASPAVKIPGDLGRTFSVPAVALIGFARGRQATAKPSVHGKAKSHRLGFTNAFARLDLPAIPIRPTPD